MSGWIEPERAARGSVIVVAGRGESAPVYERFTRRLAVDGYRSTVLADGAAPADVAAVLAGLDAPAVIVGSDTGATVAAHVAAAHPAALTGLVLAGIPAGSAEGPVDPGPEHESRSACPLHLGVLRAAVSPDALRAAAAPPDPALLANIAVPTLVVHGDADVVSPFPAAAALADAVPDGELVRVAGGRHDILNDVTHRSVAAEIVQFLERLREPVPAPLLTRTRTAGRLPIPA